MLLLHLEDEGPLREVFRTVMDTLDDSIEVIQFVSGEEAMAYIDQHLDDIRVFVLDIRVPGSIDGIEVARQVRERGSDRPIVINSGYQKPSMTIMDNLHLEWMPKPLHILNATQHIIPWVYKS